MQMLKFTCDNCNNELRPDKKNITMAYTSFTGIAVPPGKSETNKWLVVKPRDVVQGMSHFCSGKCIGEFFTKQLSSK